MTEPIKLPPFKWQMYQSVPAGPAIRMIEDYARLAVEQNTADLRAEVERLRAALTGLVDFVDGPAEGKRPDVFALRMNSARAALKEPTK